MPLLHLQIYVTLHYFSLEISVMNLPNLQVFKCYVLPVIMFYAVYRVAHETSAKLREVIHWLTFSEKFYINMSRNLNRYVVL
jgi:hypothetical protein